jgi:hypothetical protein
MSPPGVPGYPGETELPPRGTNVYQTIHSLSERVGRVEAQTAHLPQLVGDMSDVKNYLAGVKRLEAWGKHLLTKGTLLILGAVGSTYGVTRASTDAKPAPQVEVIKSATTVKVEACTAMQPGPKRDDCALTILAELIGPQAR